MKKKLSLLLAIVMIATTIIMAMPVITLPAIAADATYFSVAADQAANGVAGTYATLAAAIDAVKEGGTIEMTANYKASENVQAKTKAWTLDGNNYKWTNSGDFCVRVGATGTTGKTMAFKNITFDVGATSGKRLLQIGDGCYANLVLGEGVKLTQTGTGTASYGIMQGYNSTVTVDGAVFELTNTPAIATWQSGGPHFIVLKGGTLSTGASGAIISGYGTPAAGSIVTGVENMKIYTGQGTSRQMTNDDVKLSNVSTILPTAPSFNESGYDLVITVGGEGTNAQFANLQDAIAASNSGNADKGIDIANKKNILIKLLSDVQMTSASTVNFTNEAATVTIKGTSTTDTRHKITITTNVNNPFQIGTTGLKNVKVVFRDVDIIGEQTQGVLMRVAQSVGNQSGNDLFELSVINSTFDARIVHYYINLFADKGSNSNTPRMKLYLNGVTFKNTYNINGTGNFVPDNPAIGTGNPGHTNIITDMQIHNCVFEDNKDVAVQISGANQKILNLTITNTEFGATFLRNSGSLARCTATYTAPTAAKFAAAVAKANSLNMPAGSEFIIDVTDNITSGLSHYTLTPNAKIIVKGNNKAVTRDGHFLDATGANTSIIVKNLTINHSGSGSAVRSKARVGSLELYNVTINQSNNNNQAVVNLLGNNTGANANFGDAANGPMVFNLVIKDCTIANKNSNTIAFGNALVYGNNYEKVYATIENSTITGDKQGIVLNDNSINSVLTIKNTTINTTGVQISNAGANTYFTETFNVTTGDQLKAILKNVAKNGAIGSIAIKNDITYNNTSNDELYGTWTVDGTKTGGGRSKITMNVGNGFRVRNSFTFKNVDIEGTSTGCLFQQYNNSNLTVENSNITIRARYAAFNVCPDNGNSATLNLKNVNATATLYEGDERGVIITGNNSGNKNTVNINIENSEILAKAENGSHAGIYLTDETTGNVVVKNSSIVSENFAPIVVTSKYNGSTKSTISIDNASTIGGNIDDILYKASGESIVALGTVKVGNAAPVAFKSWSEMVNAIKTATADVVVELNEHVWVPAADFCNENGYKTTIDGNGNVVYSDATNVIRVATDMEFKNINFETIGDRNLIRTVATTVGEDQKIKVISGEDGATFAGVDLTLDNVNIYVHGGKQAEEAAYAVIDLLGYENTSNAPAAADRAAINAYFNDVIIAVENTVHKSGASVIKFGNGKENVNLVFVDSWIDTTADTSNASVRQAINANGSVGTMIISDSTIRTATGANCVNFDSAKVTASIVGSTLTTEASAGATNTDKAVKMNNGASVRISTSDLDQNGIRFTSVLSGKALAAIAAIADSDSFKFGTLITVTDAVDANGGEFDVEAIRALGWTVLDIPVKEGITVNEETGDTTIRAALINLKSNTRKYSAVAYVEFTVNGNVCRVYSDYNKTNNSRSMAEIAQYALNDLSPVRGGESGKHIYKINVGGEVKYSPYTASQRAVLEGYLN